eukprot:CAMPEP_0114613166 /NCGR_PEP_ID=MMETSP0168-20121206/4992_1 /TAXON_ID=95228 ORGANISM="Vannella sp., Strain DIVA3 517/6/12" /NCGR_SAMPLE_ID=MMETSP0168 /ASSEMBLY_ACC=CAM_ASM_000044 /LENGTH=62 /DNA_ID=CAMNT_0001824163 /DNA_START=74 /DNA_END=262 /DNA_ORIENTATION=+
MASKAPTHEILQEDDEFEEFEDEWAEAEVDEEDKVQWEDNWDDVDVDDDFSAALRKELQKTA